MSFFALYIESYSGKEQRTMKKREMPLILPFVIAPAAAALVYELQKLIGTAMFPVFDGGKTSDWSNTTYILMDIAMIILFIPSYIILFMPEKGSERIRLRETGGAGLLCTAAGAVITSVAIGLAIKFAAICGAFPVFDNVEIILKDGNPVLSVLSIVICAPLMEELVFRGLVFKSFRSISGFWFSAFMSSAVWAVIHLNLVQGIRAVGVGLFLAFVYETYQKLWVPVFAHMSINAIATASDYSGVLRGLHLESCWYLIMAALLFAALYPICRIIAKSGKCL